LVFSSIEYYRLLTKHQAFTSRMQTCPLPPLSFHSICRDLSRRISNSLESEKYILFQYPWWSAFFLPQMLHLLLFWELLPLPALWTFATGLTTGWKSHKHFLLMDQWWNMIIPLWEKGELSLLLTSVGFSTQRP